MMIEARQLMGGTGDVFDRIDEYSDRFKDTMKAKFAQSFVSSGEINTARKEATVTFVKKVGENAGEGARVETLSLS